MMMWNMANGAAAGAGPMPAQTAPGTGRAPAEVVAFWRDAGPSLWFAKDPAFDARFRDALAELYEAAARGALDPWCDTAEGALAVILLLDQYPRNSFRGTPRMYATDAKARAVAGAAIAAGFDQAVEPALRLFVYLPFGHSEGLADQDFATELCDRLGPPSHAHAEHHRDIVRRFGRFPHRNAILGRESTEAEIRYLAEGGYTG